MIAEVLLQADRPRSGDEIVPEAEWAGWEETIKHRLQIATMKECVQWHLV
jgi:hypothetical protein